MNPLLVILAGPTASGKTDASIRLAEHFGTEIISCDSRQMYRELSIGTAKPDPTQLARVPHHLINNLSIHDYYSAYLFEQDSLRLLDQLFAKYPVVIMTGGTGLYFDVLINGIDDIPDPDPEIRDSLKQRYDSEGLDGILSELSELDPAFFKTVDRNNPARVLRGMEVCLTTGRPFSSFRIKQLPKRPFDILLSGLSLPREVLYDRINRRVLVMMEAGLEEEARSLIGSRNLNALNTVGYKELFEYFDGQTSLDEAIRLIQRNTRHYAKRQITWNNKYGQMENYHPEALTDLIKRIDGLLSGRDKIPS